MAHVIFAGPPSTCHHDCLDSVVPSGTPSPLTDYAERFIWIMMGVFTHWDTLELGTILSLYRLLESRVIVKETQICDHRCSRNISPCQREKFLCICFHRICFHVLSPENRKFSLEKKKTVSYMNKYGTHFTNPTDEFIILLSLIIALYQWAEIGTACS